MSWRDAPVYVRAHDLARDLHSRCDREPAGPWGTVRGRISGRSLDLLTSVSTALSFPERRAVAQEEADRAVADLKVMLRLAAELGAITPEGARAAGDELVQIGRMIGGWRRRHPHRGSGPSPPPGA